MIGSTLGGRYLLVRQIGHGGMGRVFEARHLGTGRGVAVKVITAADAATADAAARLEVEARAAGAIVSEHIAEVLDVGADEATGAAFIVMELLTGEDLAQLLGRLGSLPPPLALRIAAQACRGLARAHAAGVVHRDIKPANIFLAERDAGARVVKILDFGIAKLRARPWEASAGARGASPLTQTGSMIGTPLYMSPEQVRGQRTIDGRTDLWSLGVVLFEALTGRAPHQRDAVGEVIVAICVDRAPPVSRVAPWVPAGIDAIVARALEIDPAARFQRAEEMLDALLALLPGEPAIHESMLFPGDAPPSTATAHAQAPTLLVQSRASTEGARPDSDRTVEVRRSEPPPGQSTVLDNLPVPLTSFIGREEQIAEARRTLHEARLCTVVGPGGTGKTRLSIQVASELRRAFEDGAAFVDLSRLTEPASIPAAIAGALGVREEPGQDLTAALTRELRPKRLLLVLDNCEHLVAACAELAESLLSACPGLRILATSREALAIDGEAILGLAPLPVPGEADDLERVSRSEAVRLFVDRARAAQPGFQLSAEIAPAVAHICRAVDGIPLAIELSAARLRGMTAAQLAERIQDRFRLLDSGRRTTAQRQRTLRATIDWSHELLAEPERAILRRLAVFQGGWSPDAAERICAWEGDPLGVAPVEVSELVAQLVSKSLVVAADRSGAGRYRLLETIRQYAWEKLEASGEAAAARARHFDHFLDLCERIEPELRSAAQLEQLARLDAEHDNIRAALDRAAGEDAERALRLGAAVGRYWLLRGRHAEGVERLSRLLAQAPSAPPALRGRALCHLATLLPGLRQAWPAWEQALAACRAAGDDWWIAFALLGPAEKALSGGDLAAAQVVLDEALGRARGAGDPWILARLLCERGRSHRSRMEIEQAVLAFSEGLALARETGDRWLIGILLHGLGMTWTFQGEHEASATLLSESLALQRTLGSKSSMTETLLTLGGALQILGRHGAAAACFQETLELSRSVGNEAYAAWAHLNLADVALLRGDLPAARHGIREGLGRFREVSRKDHLAWGLMAVAELAYREGQLAHAVSFFGAEQALEETYAIRLYPAGRARFERILETLRALLGEEAEICFRRGLSLSLEAAMQAALGYLAT